MKRRRRHAQNSAQQTEGLAGAKTLTTEQIFQRTFARATKLLAARSRSIAELRELLVKGRGSSKEAVEEVIARLREYGYLDDERFAFGYASLKLQQRPLGRQRLKRELVVKKVDRGTADEALDQVFNEVSEEDLIDRAIEKRIRIRGRPENLTQAKSLFEHLLRLGFPLELVSEKVRAVSKSDLDAETD